MITKTNHTITEKAINDALLEMPDVDFKVSLNSPSGDFFYDPWILKDTFKGTVWEEILKSLKEDDIGEARIIKLDIKNCYAMHSDIDDRWHMSFKSSEAFLVDLEEQKMHSTDKGIWYTMDAGKLHSAVNFSDEPRYQLVVRQLLKKNNLKAASRVKVLLNNVPNNFRYTLDVVISPWLNASVKNSTLNNFKVITDKNFQFDLENTEINKFNELIKKSNLDIEVTYDPLF